MQPNERARKWVFLAVLALLLWSVLQQPNVIRFGAKQWADHLALGEVRAAIDAFKARQARAAQSLDHLLGELRDRSLGATAKTQRIPVAGDVSAVERAIARLNAASRKLRELVLPAPLMISAPDRKPSPRDGLLAAAAPIDLAGLLGRTPLTVSTPVASGGASASGAASNPAVSGPGTPPAAGSGSGSGTPGFSPGFPPILPPSRPPVRVTPEPGSLALVALGLIALALGRKRGRRR